MDRFPGTTTIWRNIQMSDTTVNESNEEELDIESSDGNLAVLWDKIMAAIAAKDEQLDALNPETGVRRQFLNDLDADFGAYASEKVTDTLIGQLTGFAEDDPRKAYGLYLAITSRLRKAFQKNVDAWVEAQVDALPKPEAVNVSDDEKAALSAKRSEYYAMAKQVFDIGSKLLPNSVTKDWEMPKIRRGGSGKRGKRALYSYTWAIDGEGVPEDSDNPKGVAELLGFEKVGDFTKALRECLVTDEDGKRAKLNTTKPPREFEVTVSGKLVSATKVEEANGDDEDSDEDDSDDE